MLMAGADDTDTPILSLDTPSGVDSTTGETAGEAIAPTWPLTLALPKTRLLPEKTGALFLADIGIPPRAYAWESLQLPYVPPFGDRYRIPLHYEPF